MNSEEYFVTICTKNRNQFLTEGNAPCILRNELDDAYKNHGWSIGPYCVMPDHIHFFCRPVDRSKSLSKFIGLWKQWTSKQIKVDLNEESNSWQSGFFDHLIRNNESAAEKWEYVRLNPVRAKLVEDANEWPHCGYIHYRY